MGDQSIKIFLKTVAELWAAALQAATAEADSKYLPLAEAWLRYKQDMRPETRNDYLRASSRVFDCAISAPLLEKREEV